MYCIINYILVLLDDTNVDTKNEQKLKYMCEECKIEFKYRSVYIKHMAKHNPASISCPVCAKLFKRKDTLTVHFFF